MRFIVLQGRSHVSKPKSELGPSSRNLIEFTQLEGHYGASFTNTSTWNSLKNCYYCFGCFNSEFSYFTESISACQIICFLHHSGSLQHWYYCDCSCPLIDEMKLHLLLFSIVHFYMWWLKQIWWQVPRLQVATKPVDVTNRKIGKTLKTCFS